MILLLLFVMKGSEKMAERSKRIVMYDEDKLEHINPENIKTVSKVSSRYVYS